MNRNDFLEEGKDDELPTAEKKPVSHAKRITAGIILIAAMALLGIFLPHLLEFISPQLLDNAQTTENKTSDADTTADSGASWLSIEMPLPRYSRLVSSVPGMPIRAVCPQADAIEFKTVSGLFITWNAPDYRVNEQGDTCMAVSGDTVYYRPPDSENPSAEERTIYAKALSNGTQIGFAVIIVHYTDDAELEVESISVSCVGKR